METVNNPYVFQTDSEIVKKAFLKDNYLIEYNQQCQDHTLCAIYFSSNDIYFPNSEEVFRKRIVEKNAYEWYGTRVEKAYKHVFVRDIQKQWYIEGINSRASSPELLLELLRNETAGYDVVTIGSSAGGYAAVLYGSLLNAEKILSFNGQFEIRSLLSSSKRETNPLLFFHANDHLSIYLDLKKALQFNENIYYFVSLNSPWDIAQYNHVKEMSELKIIGFKTSHHGIPFLKSALPFVINLSKQELMSYTGKTQSPFFFTVKIIGIFEALRSVVFQMYNKYKRRK